MLLHHDCNVRAPAGNGEQSKIIQKKTKQKTKNKKQKKQNKNTTVTSSVTHSPRQLHPSRTSLYNPQQQITHNYIVPSQINRHHIANRSTKHKTFGDKISQKKSGHIRIISQNIGCIGVSNLINHKQDQAKDWLLQHNVDIAGWQETGVAFHTLPIHQRLSSRINDIRWKKVRVTSYNNRHENIGKFQYGGTAMLAFNESAHRIKQSGGDPTGLGRWSWILFEGKHQYQTRIISAYIPCKSPDDNRQSVYNQHKRYFLHHGITECPRTLLHTQLCQHIKLWQAQGNNIVLLIDTNENLSQMGQLQTKLLYECDLIDPIRNLYSNSHTTLPPTSSTGSVPIDSIFVSQNLQHISKGGWIRIEESIGNHRALFIDIPTKILLGESPFHIHQNTARRLTCDNPQVINKYNKHLRKQLNHEKTFQSFHNFEYRYKTESLHKKHLIHLLDKIDNSITNSIIYAEKKCRKFKAGNVPYTPELSNAGKTINVWSNVIKKKKGHNISSTYIKRIGKQVEIYCPMDLSLNDCEHERKLAINKYYKLKKRATTDRIQFIKDLATQQAALGNESVSNAILRLNKNEELRASYKRIKLVTKPFHGSTQKILIMNKHTQEETITTDKITIERAICQQNIKKFKSAYSSPFLRKPLINHLGQHATNLNAKKILDGTYNRHAKLSSTTKKFIKQLKIPHTITQHNNSYCDINTAITYWQKKKERTNSSMSSRHIGTYKALTFNNIPVLNMINEIANYAFNIGLSLKRWTKDLDVSLLKKPNKIRPSELRTIGTLEADFNQHASLHFSKRMIKTGIDNQIIPTSQYAKKGNRSIEAAIVKILYFDYLRINKINGAFLAMDLENCFDRMAHPVSSLSSQRLGVAPSVANCMIDTLCRMKHYIRTAYGDSEWYYRKKRKPLQGAIQGNAAASPIFIAISSVITSFLEKNIIGVYIQSAITFTIFTLTAIMYVDDSDILLAAKNNNETPHTTRNRAQRAAITYQNAVEQTGGAIRPEKCRWYLIKFHYKGGSWHYTQKDSVPPIVIKNSQGDLQQIEQLDIKTGWKGLGIVSAPNGNWNDHVTYLLKEKIQPWNIAIKSTYLFKHDVYRSATTSIFKSVEYTLPATSLTSTQCKTINTNLHKTYLPRIGIESHLPLVYRYSSHRYQGLGSFDTEVQQFIEKIKIFLFHAGTKSQLGQFIQISLESLHLLIGVNTPIFQLPYSKYGILAEKGWIEHLWKMTNFYNIKVEGYYEHTTLTRLNDKSLMESIINSDTYTDNEIRSINRCRLYLQVQNLSDITNGQGTNITYCARNHIRDPERITIYHWPNQPKPPKRDWELWDDALLHNLTTSEQLQISPRLQTWHKYPPFTSPWTYSPSTENLYYKTSSTTYNNYNITRHSRHHTTTYSLQNHTSLTPNDVIPCIVNRINPHQPILESIINPTITPSHNQRHIQYHNNIFMNQTCPPSNNIEFLTQAIQESSAIAVTDASVSPHTNIGATSFIITTPDLQTSYRGSHGVPLGSKPMESYRAELYGIFSILQCLQHITNTYNIMNGEILIACDNKSSLLKALQYTSRTKPTQPSFDILWAIQKLLNTLPIKIQYQHVKGHQDEVQTSLSNLEYLNCLMDQKAKQYREQIESTPNYEYSKIHFLSNWICKTSENTITENISLHIKHQIYHKKMKHHLTHHQQYTNEAFELIDWNAIHKASMNLHTSRQIWLTKFTSGFCATAQRMKIRKQWETNICPICKLDIETTSHIIQCTDPCVKEHYKKCAKNFFRYLHSINTHPNIIQIFKQTLQTSTPTTFVSQISSYETNTLFLQAAHEQDIIGWTNIFKGHISSTWSKIQYQYISEFYQHPPSLHHWSKNIILQLYDFTHSMWTNRNNIIHNKVEESLNIRESTLLTQQIIDEYHNGITNILPQHYYMFNQPLQHILNKSVSDKKYWLLTVQASRACLEQSSNEERQQQDIILEHATVPD